MSSNRVCNDTVAVLILSTENRRAVESRHYQKERTKVNLQVIRFILNFFFSPPPLLSERV
jgi:hypothetical protein